MISTVHSEHLNAKLRTAEAQLKGWQDVLDYAVSRCPESIVEDLRATLAGAERDMEGWRGLYDFADAHRSLPRDLAPSDVAQYSTGPRMDPPASKPCHCGLPGTPGTVHLDDGRPCYPIRSDVAVSLLNEDPAPTSVLPQVHEPTRARPYTSTEPSVFSGEALKPRQELAIDRMVADHAEQTHAEALADHAKWERKNR